MECMRLRNSIKVVTNTFQHPLSFTFGTVYLQRHSNGLLQKITLNEILPPLNLVTSMLSDVKNSLQKRLESSIFPPPPQSGIKIQGDVQTPLKKCPRQKYPRRGPCTLMPSPKDRLRPTKIQRQRPKEMSIYIDAKKMDYGLRKSGLKQ